MKFYTTEQVRTGSVPTFSSFRRVVQLIQLIVKQDASLVVEGAMFYGSIFSGLLRMSDLNMAVVYCDTKALEWEVVKSKMVALAQKENIDLQIVEAQQAPYGGIMLSTTEGSPMLWAALTKTVHRCRSLEDTVRLPFHGEHCFKKVEERIPLLNEDWDIFHGYLRNQQYLLSIERMTFGSRNECDQLARIGKFTDVVFLLLKQHLMANGQIGLLASKQEIMSISLIFHHNHHDLGRLLLQFEKMVVMYNRVLNEFCGDPTNVVVGYSYEQVLTSIRKRALPLVLDILEEYMKPINWR